MHRKKLQMCLKYNQGTPVAAVNFTLSNALVYRRAAFWPELELGSKETHTVSFLAPQEIDTDRRPGYG